MRLTKKRNGKNVIPLLNAVLVGIDMPYWGIDRADSLHTYLSGDAADKLAAYEDAEEQGRLLILPCKIGDKVFRVVPKCSMSYIQCPYNGGYGLDRCNNCDAFIQEEPFCLFMFEDIGKTVFLTREKAEAALNGAARGGKQT